MRVALIHYWLVAERGGEKVLRALCDMFPQAVIFTHVADRVLTDRLFPGHEIRESFIAKLPFARRAYKSYLPLMPLALEELDLRGFDLVIAFESGPAKGAITDPGAVHVCYCFTPMRYIWDHYRLYRDNAGFLARMTLPFFAHWLRQWDFASAARVDAFIADSAFVGQRIKKYYRRESTVVHPPVDIEAFAATPRGADPRFAGAYLWVGQLTAYKRPDIAVSALAGIKRRLIVIGDGEETEALKAMADNDYIEFLGRAPDEVVRRAFASARALIFPGEEDFGMTPVEAMASGLPVIALGRGGALSTVVDGETGILFDDQSREGLQAAVRRFESMEATFDSDVLRRHAQQFSTHAFKQAMTEALRIAGVAIRNDVSPARGETNEAIFPQSQLREISAFPKR
ncbi:MAG: glycosyltransferase [Amphiplicatus sp.]